MTENKKRGNLNAKENYTSIKKITMILNEVYEVVANLKD